LEKGSGMRLARRVCCYARCERATTSIEYALIARWVAIGFLAGLKALATVPAGAPPKITRAMKNAGP